MTSRTIIKSSGYNFARHKSGSFEINFSIKKGNHLGLLILYTDWLTRIRDLLICI